MTAQGWLRYMRTRTGSVAGDIAILLVMLACAWAVIGWQTLRGQAGKIPVRMPLWVLAITLWPASSLLSFVGVLPARPDPGDRLIDSVAVAVAVGALAFRLRQWRRRQRDQRAWIEQKAERSLRLRAGETSDRHPVIAHPAVQAVPHHCQLGQFNTARLDEHDMQFAEVRAQVGEILWSVREACARAGVTYVPAPGPADRPGLRVVRGGEAS